VSAARSQEPGDLAVTGLAVMSPLGHDAEQTCAAIRAGINGVGEHPYFNVETPDPEWDEAERLLAGLVPGIDPWLGGRERLVELALPTLRSLCERARLLRAELGRTALLLSLPQPDEAVRAWQLDASLAEELCLRAGLRPFAPSRVDQSGHASMLRMLGEAAALLDAGEADRCIVLGVDSYHDEQRLAVLDRTYRLRSARCKDGFLPGEAAIALLVESAASPARSSLIDLGRPTFGVEPRTLRGDLSSTGTGLCQVIAGALGERGARWVLCDLNGESYRSFEWGLARTRLPERFAATFRLVHPADCVGDVGAASGGLLVACAAQAFARAYAPAESALVWASSDEGLRAAMLVNAPADR
jgi:3-oxoacyl-[acyl-carrier-protein] synthase-1